ncbi:MAG: M48 family metallopeptidase [Neisseriaceae bacterium]|nr:M48 family metallopeptidase [Neisseriaceae bacterium]
MQQETVQSLFIVLFVLSMVLKLSLSWRQSRHVLHHDDQVPRPFRQAVSLSEHQLAADYTLAKQRLARYQIIYDGFVLLLLTLGGGLNWLAVASMSLSDHPLVQGVLLICLYVIVAFVLSWPFLYYRQFKLESDFGFNQSSLGLFVADQLKGLVLMLALMLPLVALVLWFMGVAGSLWWVWAWVALVGFTLFVQWFFPTVIAPRFNQFQSLPDGPLREAVLGLLAETGFDSQGVYVMDGSKRSSHGNAYFSGLGKQKRIVLFDTLIDQLSTEEIVAVLAHELGHFKKKHILKNLCRSMGLSLVALLGLHVLMQQGGFYQGLGVAFPSHAMALLLFLLVLPLLTFVFTPLGFALSRRDEYEADAFACAHSRPEHLASALVTLYKRNASTLTPDPLYAWFYDSHPRALLRIKAIERLAAEKESLHA